MSKQNKTEENLKDKIFGFFRPKDKSAPVAYQKATAKEFVFTLEILKDIGAESPPNYRLKAIKELADEVSKKKLEENAIEAVWNSIQDMLLPEASTENRKAALHFLQSLLEGQLNHLGILRGHFFDVIRNISVPEDLNQRLTLFNILSENGRNLQNFEEETGTKTDRTEIHLLGTTTCQESISFEKNRIGVIMAIIMTDKLISEGKQVSEKNQKLFYRFFSESRFVQGR
ncbi:hypothetical protein CHS0354_015119 [Potamilus streckersoni]|uniref:Tuberin N-terminal domain-containing protein n=1 Tax=Potamilus streckersoni TaxID=2493646 RepID=A0AAE0SRT2_9BIVA|nr:hypothetical protein CHS0354_015119 [Potamilus streckersoni]